MKKALQILYFLIPFCLLGVLPIALFLSAEDAVNLPSFMGNSEYLKQLLSDPELMLLIARQFVLPAIAALIAGAMTAAVFFIVFRKHEIKGVKSFAVCMTAFGAAVVVAGFIRYSQTLHYGRLPYYPSYTIVVNYSELAASLMSIDTLIILQIGIVISFLAWIASIIVNKIKHNSSERLPS